MHKSWLIISCTVLVGLIIFTLFIIPLKKNYDAKHIDIQGLYLINPLPVENFELVDQYNKPFTKENLKNHWSLLFFGFTHCDMVCPVTLNSLAIFYKNIEKKLPEKEIPKIVFITIDPDKDTPERLKKYLAQFNPHFIGARTSLEKTQIIKNQFHIYSEKVQSNNQYNHSTEVLLINPQSEIQAYFSFPPHPEQLEKDYIEILNRKRSIS